jgi:hypothetical protein
MDKNRDKKSLSSAKVLLFTQAVTGFADERFKPRALILEFLMLGGTRRQPIVSVASS